MIGLNGINVSLLQEWEKKQIEDEMYISSKSIDYNDKKKEFYRHRHIQMMFKRVIINDRKCISYEPYET